MEKQKKLLVVGLFLVYTLSFISSANVGISPASVAFENVIRGGYAERYVVISSDSESPVNVTLTPRGDISEWINYSESSFVVSRSEPYYLKLSIVPPTDIPNGNYTGFLRVAMSGDSVNIENSAVGIIQPVLDLSIFVSVTDIEIVDCAVRGVQIFSAEESEEVLLKMKVKNNGNIRLNPEVLFDIWDLDQISILDSQDFLGDTVLPTVEKDVEFRIDSSLLDVGQYWGDLIVPQCFYEGLLTFDILESGALKAQGVLLNILSKGSAEKGENVPFEASFKNTGEKEVEAVFKGQVTRSGKVVQIIESEKSLVPVDSIEKFDFYFTPGKEGTYIVSGRVYYSGKKTYEASTTLEVLGSKFSIMPFLYGFFILAILILFYKIRKEKKVYARKLRNLR